MKKKIQIALLLIGVTVSVSAVVSIIYGAYMAKKYVEYSIQHEPFVKQTIKATVKKECLR